MIMTRSLVAPNCFSTASRHSCSTQTRSEKRKGRGSRSVPWQGPRWPHSHRGMPERPARGPPTANHRGEEASQERDAHAQLPSTVTFSKGGGHFLCAYMARRADVMIPLQLLRHARHDAPRAATYYDHVIDWHVILYETCMHVWRCCCDVNARKRPVTFELSVVYHSAQNIWTDTCVCVVPGVQQCLSIKYNRTTK